MRLQLVPKNIPSEELLAHIAVSKLADALPQKFFAHMGIAISGGAMAHWIVLAAKHRQPLKLKKALWYPACHYG